MRLNLKQRIVGFFILVPLMPLALIGWICFILGIILELFGEYCLNLEIYIAEQYYKLK